MRIDGNDECARCGYPIGTMPSRETGIMNGRDGLTWSLLPVADAPL